MNVYDSKTKIGIYRYTDINEYGNSFYIIKSKSLQNGVMTANLEYNGNDTTYLTDYNKIIKNLVLEI